MHIREATRMVAVQITQHEQNPQATTMEYFIYMLECSNGAYYTGYTTNLERRYQEHVDGSPKCKYTRSFPPVRLAASWKIQGDLALVMKLERAIKKMRVGEKVALIEQPELFATTFDLDCPRLRNDTL